MFDTKPEIGIALGGGAVLGVAHLGILKALEEHNLKPNMITGTSIGAIMAALYGFGLAPDDIKKAVSKMDWWDVSNFAWSRFGLLSNQKMGHFLREHIGDVDFKDLDIPLAFMATDICSGAKVVLNEGSVAEAAMVSACVPGLFTPYEKEDRLLVDGGIVENVPVSPLLDMGADFILAVDLNGSSEHRRPEDMIDVLINALDIAIDSHTSEQLHAAHYVLSMDLAHFSRTSAAHIDELFQVGYETCQSQIGLIRDSAEKHTPGLLQKLIDLPGF